MHLCSINMDVNRLWPAVTYPVPVGTPLISPLVQWDHAQTWDVPQAEDFPSGSGGSNSASIYNIGKDCTCGIKLGIHIVRGRLGRWTQDAEIQLRSLFNEKVLTVK